MISEKLIVQNFLQPRGTADRKAQAEDAGVKFGLSDRESPVYETKVKFSVHLGYELKVELEQGDCVRFVDDNLLVVDSENQTTQHAVPLKSVIYLSAP
jgi:hypothetical protein